MSLNPYVIARLGFAPLTRNNPWAEDADVAGTDGLLRLVGDRVRVARERQGLSQVGLAARAGVNKETVNRLEKGDNVSIETLSSVAMALGYEPAALLREQGPQDEAIEIEDDVTDGYKRDDIPVVGEGDASPSPNLFWDETGLRSDVEDRISRPYDVRDPRAYGVRVRGDSMIPRFQSGDTVVVSPNTPVQDGDEVYVALLSGERLIKRAKRARGGWILESYNSNFDARYVTNVEIGTMHPVLWIRPRRRPKGSA